MRTVSLFAAAALAMGAFLPGAASAQSCLEQIVALQARVKKVAPVAQPATQPEGTGATLDHQPTPSSVAAAGGDVPAPPGPAAALNAAQNYQAAGDEAACLKAVNEARAMLEGK